MRHLRWIITLPLALLAISFALSNRDLIELRLEPLPFIATMPIYGLALSALLLGFMAGGVMVGVGALRTRLRARSLARRVEALEQEMATLRKTGDQKPVTVTNPVSKAA